MVSAINELIVFMLGNLNYYLIYKKKYIDV